MLLRHEDLDRSFEPERTAIDAIDLELMTEALQAIARSTTIDGVIGTLLGSLLRCAVPRGTPCAALVVRDDAGRWCVEGPAGIRPKIPSALLDDVLSNRRRVVVTDDPDLCAAPRSAVCLPLTHASNLVGALYLEDDAPGGFASPRGLTMLTLLAAQVAIAIDDTRHLQSVVQKEAERPHAEHLLDGERRVLEMIAKGTPLGACLDELCRVVEDAMPGRVCAILLAGSGPLRHGAAPSLSPTFLRAYPNPSTVLSQPFGPCGSAARCGEPVIVEDIATETRWPAFSALASAHGLRACWSWPIMARGDVLGTFAIYSEAPGAPRPDHHALVGQITHLASVAIDRARSEEAFALLRSELTHVGRVATLGELTASIAHELNQPLAGILVNARTCARWLDREEPNLFEAREAMNRIARDAKRAADTIASLRDLFRKKSSPNEAIDIADLVREVVALTRTELQRHGIQLQTDLINPSPSVSCDRVQIQQVVLNLVLNAMEAMTGIVDRPREVTIATRVLDDQLVVVSVSDTGTGVDPRAAQNLFDPFFTTKASGMGMGLSISRSIVQDHGGTIWAEAGPVHGTTVQFTIPASDAASFRSGSARSS